MSIKSRRIIALLLCFVMVFTAMPVSAFAVEDPVGQVTEQNESEAVVSPDDVSADIDEQTTTEDNPTADVDNEPAVEEETPAVEEEIPAIDEIPVLGGAITEQYGIMLLNEVMLLGDATGTVYISISYDGKYVNGNNEKPVAYVPVSLSDLQEIDLADYGLTGYDYNGQLTALHLYIYAHENIMGKEWSEVDVQGSAGSIFFANGLFGFSDCNLQYYYNGEYPADENGWGITADQLVLNNGDFFDIAGYTSWAFYGDSVTGFHYFLDNEEITHEYTATAGEALTVTLGRGASFMGEGYTMTKVADYTVSYGAELGAADGTVTTNADGQAEITFDEAGIYYLWVDGGKGNENPTDIVSSPAYAKVTVEAAEEPAPVTYTVTLPAEGVGYTVAATEDSVSPVTEGGSYSFTVDIAEGYEAGENFAVKANDVVLNAVESVYTIANITAEQTVTVEGVVEKVKEPTPFSQKVTVPSNGNSSWGYVS
ncbi:MAG: hypothetical protein IJB67_07935, partial [Firmicutes bacterium]|nr:hypothetical protein [Bacillota bacterium]